MERKGGGRRENTLQCTTSKGTFTEVMEHVGDQGRKKKAPARQAKHRTGQTFSLYPDPRHSFRTE